MTGPGRWRLLDLFCKAGGASAGYHAAGFDVTGVDIEAQPDYPFRFIRADALSVELDGFDVVHASPPCQAFSAATPAQRRAEHPDLIGPVRNRLNAKTSRPGRPRLWVIENVPGAPLRDPVLICGDTLRLGVRRHRLFESNTPLAGTGCVHDRTTPTVPVYGTYGQRIPRAGLDRVSSPGTDAARTAMGIDWMPWPALTQAIPPAYTHWLGVQLAAALARDASTAARRDETDQGASVTGDGTPPAGLRHRGTEPAGGVGHALVVPSDGNPSTGFRHCRCGQPLPPRPPAGRWPRYCSHACRQAAYRDRTRTGATA
jgi:hypothetical protein